MTKVVYCVFETHAGSTMMVGVRKSEEAANKLVDKSKAKFSHTYAPKYHVEIWSLEE